MAKYHLEKSKSKVVSEDEASRLLSSLGLVWAEDQKTPMSYFLNSIEEIDFDGSAYGFPAYVHQLSNTKHNKALQLTARYHVSRVTFFLELNADRAPQLKAVVERLAYSFWW